MFKTDLTSTALAAAQQAPPAASFGGDIIESGASKLEAVPADIAQLPLFQHLSAVMPVADLLLGGGMLGWSGSVLVDLIGRCQKIKDVAPARSSEAQASHKKR